MTYKQAAEVQPFANGLVNMDLTGAQIKDGAGAAVAGGGCVASVPEAGCISTGFTYTSVPPPAGSPAGTKGTVTGMWLDGTPIGLATTYSVTVNSFLSSGGDGFPAFDSGTTRPRHRHDRPAGDGQLHRRVREHR